jgi:hypothetical protein
MKTKKVQAGKVFGLRLGKKGLRATIRKRITDNETERFKHIVSHPQFKENPLEAIQSFLRHQNQAINLPNLHYFVVSRLVSVVYRPQYRH